MPCWGCGENSYDNRLAKVAVIRLRCNEASQIPLLVRPVLIEEWTRLLKSALEPSEEL